MSNEHHEAAALTVIETAQKLKIHVNTVRKLAQNGALPAVKIGHSWRFSPAVIDAMLRGAAPVSTSTAK